MKREIKFRGKKINTGFLIIQNYKSENMGIRKQKLINQKFILESIYGKEAIDIALCGWSRFKGPCYDKIWLTSEFEIFCWCAKQGLDKRLLRDATYMNYTESQQALSLYDQIKVDNCNFEIKDK